MIGIQHISTYLPPNHIDNLARSEALGVSEEQVRNKIGFVRVAIKSEDQDTTQLAAAVFSQLIEQTNLDPAHIDALIVVTQNPGRNIPHVSAELHGLFSLRRDCACFDISLGCSGYVYGLSIVSAFMQANGLKRGILITADPYSKIIDPNDKATALIFGDGATATLLSEAPLFTIGKFRFGTLGSEANKLCCDDGRLTMNGRAVFNFAAINVPDNIRDAVQANDLTLDQVDQFLLHQGSRYIVDTIADRLGLANEKMPFLSADYGNTVSSSIPMMLAQSLPDVTQKKIVLSGFGVGFSWGSTVIQRKE